MKKSILGIILLSTLSLAGCVGNESTSHTSVSARDKSDSKEIVYSTYDYEKKAVKQTLKKVPQRVVATYQSPIEIMLALGLEDNLVATAQLDTDVKPELQEAFNDITYYKQAPSKEEVLNLNPDFIFSWYSYFAPDKLGNTEFWTSRGANTYISQNSGIQTPNTLENEYEDILTIGNIFSVESKAKAMVDKMKGEIDKAIEFSEGKEKIRAIIFEINKDGQYRVYGKNSIGGDMAEQVGAELVADKNGNITKEELISLNPDVIFSVYYGEAIEKEQATTQIVDNPSLKNLEAVKNNRVYPMVLSNVYSTGIRTLDGIQAFSKGLYPELYKNN